MAKSTENPLSKLMGVKPDSSMKSSEESGEYKSSGGQCNCVEELVEAQQAIRLQHWLTKSFAQHKALGKAYEDLDELIDDFVETLVGAKGRDVLSDVKEVSLEGNPMQILGALEDCLRNEIPKLVGEKETALLNIRDDMLGLVQHTRYLLTLS